MPKTHNEQENAPDSPTVTKTRNNNTLKIVYREVIFMYTNELLEEKCKTQKRLYKQAEDIHEDYSTVMEKSVASLFKKKSWNLDYSIRKGGYLITQ